MTTNSTKFPYICLGFYLLVVALCAINPHDLTVFFAEIIPIWVIVGLIIWASRYHRFSNTAYALMTVLPVMHTIGAHFTFELVPFDWVTNTFNFERNHYDRVGHFAVGFFAYAMAEAAAANQLVRTRTLVLGLPVVTVLAIAGLYEILEWIWAINADPTAGAAVLGSQGDIWDAQKDMLADTLGAVFAVTLFAALPRNKPLLDKAKQPLDQPQ
ncbi:DUF2238 domain-containing protein [Sulfuriroseicoccus oceanibius]|uniref:DUF2238 domain-containing protein n=1 Tax=Sulfuriroseicoccus oceanibius TaxID=2707525 RepID=A0A6B3L4S5_9BACT|nr:DUF2238 domain-containing protein [Sulfuriroseicoccus oceanibius]QQL45697.1 DUF2238 domain-containing protein [Sulfuriroseicoccus oceanibius]